MSATQKRPLDISDSENACPLEKRRTKLQPAPKKISNTGGIKETKKSILTENVVAQPKNVIEVDIDLQPTRISKRLIEKKRVVTRRRSVVVVEINGTKRCRKKAKVPEEKPASKNSVQRKEVHVDIAPTQLSANATIYQEAKALFRRTAAVACLVGRSNERQIIHKFWNDHVIANKAGSLYISGAPGTGKTALLNETVKTLAPQTTSSGKRVTESTNHTISVHTVNCMAVADPKAIYSKILAEIKGVTMGYKDAVRDLQETFCEKESKKLYAIILDEIDCLITKDQEVLYKLFEWPTLPGSRLVLIGIANALDLTDRFLPRLRAKDLEPQLLHFNPYQVPEITEIIKSRLRSLDRRKLSTEERSNDDDPFVVPEDTPKALGLIPLMQTAAIELCARKVASATGDLRKALDVCRQAIELAEADAYKKRASSKGTSIEKLNPTAIKNSTSAEEIDAPFTAATAPKATISHVLKVLSSTLGSAGLQKVKDLSLQQKQLLAVFLLLNHYHKLSVASAFTTVATASHDPHPTTDDTLTALTSSSTVNNTGREITVASLYEAYVYYCSFKKTTLLTAVSRSEYADIVACLEMTGILDVRARRGRAGSSSTTTSRGGRHQAGGSRGRVSSGKKSNAAGSPFIANPCKLAFSAAGSNDPTNRLVTLAAIQEEDIVKAISDIPVLKAFYEDALRADTKAQRKLDMEYMATTTAASAAASSDSFATVGGAVGMIAVD